VTLFSESWRAYLYSHFEEKHQTASHHPVFSTKFPVISTDFKNGAAVIASYCGLVVVAHLSLPDIIFALDMLYVVDIIYSPET
jgi:hypothetical protein